MKTLPAASERPVVSTEDFIECFPWPEDRDGPERPMDFLWHFDLDASIEQIWPYLIDTSSFNRRLGLPPMQFSEKNGRLHGVSDNAGIRMEWEEIPWEWEYGKGLNSARVYSRGFARYVRARYILEDLGAGRIRLYVYFGWIPRGWKGRLILSFGMKQLEKKYRQALNDIVKLIGLKEKMAQAPAPREKLAIDAVRLQKAVKALRDSGLEETWIERFVRMIQNEPDLELHRIRVRVLARRWDADERALLRAFLQATREGLFLLTWDVICPHCLGVRNEISHLGEIPPMEECEACGIDFETTGLNSIEITFRIHPSIRKVEKRMYCAAEPATKAHIKLQRNLPPGESVFLSTLIGNGRYRLRTLGRKDYNLMELQDGLGRKEIHWKDSDCGLTHGHSPRPDLRLENTSAEEKTFVLEEMRVDSEALRPSELFSFQEFRDLFSEEAVASGVQLDIGRQTILFTDVVGSTKFYEQEGDGKAFAHIRKHFVQAYETVRNNGGAVVKTIGDAVMAGFVHPEAALRAAVELQKAFSPETPGNALRIRITLHSGQCLAVNLNSNIDYFGSTVNLTAKLQAAAGAGQIVFTDPISDDPGVRQYLSAKNFSPQSERFPFSWSSGEVRIHRIEIR
jgi:class 3 adenylate cyclase